MSKEFKNIDQLFQNELSGMQAKAPAHVKANIDKAIGTGKRRGLWFFLIPILLIGISVPAAIILSNPSEESSEIIADNNINQMEESGDHSLTHDANSETSENVISNENDATELIDQQLNDSQNNNTFSTSSNGHESIHSNNSLNTIQSNSNLNSSQNSTNSNKELSSESNNREQINSNNISENSTQENTEENSSNTKEVENQSTNSEVVDSNNSENTQNESESSNSETTENNTNSSSDEESTENNTSEKNNQNSSNEEVTENNSQETENNSTQEESESSNNEENTESTVEESEKESTEVVGNEDQNSTDSTAQDTNDPDHNLDPKKEEEKRWMISVLGGGVFKNSNIITGNDTLDAEYSQLSDRPGFGVGVDVNYRLRNGLMFGAGVLYSSQSENYDYQKSTTVLSDSTVSWNVFVTDSIVDTLGTTYIYDSTQTVNYTYSTQELYNQQGTNKTSFLHIPFRFGFQYLFKEKWRFDAYAQGRFNLLLNTNAVFVQNDALVTSTLKNSYFDLEIGGRAHYKLWKNLYISGVFRYRPPLRNPYYAPTIQNKMQYLYVGGGVSLTF